MDKVQLIKNAIDASGFQSTATAAGYINPEVWNRQVLRFVEDTIIVSSFAKVYDDLLGAPGDTLNVTVNSAPSSASSVAESADVTVSAYSVTQVTFTPTEYAFAHQLSDKEARRAFYDVAMDMSAKIGYALALKRDQDAVDTLTSGAGNAIFANGVTVSSDVASTDTLDWDDIVNAMKEVWIDKLVPRVLFVSPVQLADLMKTQPFRDASQYGGRETILGGELTKVGGLRVLFSTLITATSNVEKAILLGYDLSAEPPFGIARKALPTVRSERHELGRYTDFVGVEEWDIAVLRDNGICTIGTYRA